MASPRAYPTFQDFEREEIRPGMRIGWSLDEIDASAESALDFDADPFEIALDAAEYEDDDDEE